MDANGNLSRGETRAIQIALLLALVMMLVGCAHTSPAVEVRTERVEVKVPIACPSPEERARLRALRPTPLRLKPRPATVVERLAAQAAQLVALDDEGAWADQVDAVLDRCQRP